MELDWCFWWKSSSGSYLGSCDPYFFPSHNYLVWMQWGNCCQLSLSRGVERPAVENGSQCECFDPLTRCWAKASTNHLEHRLCRECLISCQCQMNSQELVKEHRLQMVKNMPLVRFYIYQLWIQHILFKAFWSSFLWLMLALLELREVNHLAQVVTGAARTWTQISLGLV